MTGNFASAAVQITISTSPANLLVSADGGTFTAAPLIESWIPGSSHMIATSSPQAGGTGVQYVWSNWSDSGSDLAQHHRAVDRNHLYGQL